MQTSREVELQRSLDRVERAPMQKLFVAGHLLPGANISAQHVNDFLTGLGAVCGMNIFDGPHIKTPELYDQETFERLGNRPPEDVNGSVMWDDSGAQMYIFPNKGNWFTLDIYTCKNFDPDKVLQYVYDALDPAEDMVHSQQDAQIVTPWQQFIRQDPQTITSEATLVSQVDELFDVEPNNLSQVFNAGRKLEELVITSIRNGSGKRLAASYTHRQIEQLRAIHSAFEIATDAQFMEDVISGSATHSDQYPFQNKYDRLAQLEGQALGIDSIRPIMHIGTGWPGTAIGLNRQFNVPVLCVENNPEVAKRSQIALDKLGLLAANKLQVVLANGQDLNPEKYKAVIVSAMVPSQDKKQIIRNLRELAEGGTSEPLLVLRTPADRARSFLYQELPREIFLDPNLIPIDDTSSLIQSEDHLKSVVFRPREFAEIRRGSDRIVLTARSKLVAV